MAYGLQVEITVLSDANAHISYNLLEELDGFEPQDDGFYLRAASGITGGKARFDQLVQANVYGFIFPHEDILVRFLEEIVTGDTEVLVGQEGALLLSSGQVHVIGNDAEAAAAGRAEGKAAFAVIDGALEDPPAFLVALRKALAAPRIEDVMEDDAPELNTQNVPVIVPPDSLLATASLRNGDGPPAFDRAIYIGSFDLSRDDLIRDIFAAFGVSDFILTRDTDSEDVFAEKEMEDQTISVNAPTYLPDRPWMAGLASLVEVSVSREPYFPSSFPEQIEDWARIFGVVAVVQSDFESADTQLEGQRVEAGGAPERFTDQFNDEDLAADP